MATEDQDAEVGRLIRERRDLLAQRGALLSKAGKAGKLLAAVGKALYVQPPGGAFPTGTLSVDADGSVKVSDEYVNQVLTGQLPSAVDLQVLLTEVRSVDQRLSQIGTHLKPFGV